MLNNNNEYASDLLCDSLMIHAREGLFTFLLGQITVINHLAIIRHRSSNLQAKGKENQQARSLLNTRRLPHYCAFLRSPYPDLVAVVAGGWLVKLKQKNSGPATADAAH